MNTFKNITSKHINTVYNKKRPSIETSKASMNFYQQDLIEENNLPNLTTLKGIQSTNGTLSGDYSDQTMQIYERYYRNRLFFVQKDKVYLDHRVLKDMI